MNALRFLYWNVWREHVLVKVLLFFEYLKNLLRCGKWMVLIHSYYDNNDQFHIDVIDVFKANKKQRREILYSCVQLSKKTYEFSKEDMFYMISLRRFKRNHTYGSSGIAMIRNNHK